MFLYILKNKWCNVLRKVGISKQPWNRVKQLNSSTFYKECEWEMDIFFKCKDPVDARERERMAHQYLRIRGKQIFPWKLKTLGIKEGATECFNMDETVRQEVINLYMRDADER